MTRPLAPSDHFDGKRFFNPGAHPHRFRDVWRWYRERRPGAWREWIDAAPGPKPPERVGEGELRATFVNHSTFLLQLDGLNVLTDPIWSERASPFASIGPRRHRPPGIRFDDLPPIDSVLLSHNHYDHMDYPTLRRIARRFRPAIFVPLRNARFVRAFGFREIVEMDWWERSPLINGVECECVPAQHFSGRLPWTRDRALWCGFVLRGRYGNVCFAADTGWGNHFADVAARCAPLRLALLPIGAYLPRWFMAPVHISPDQALEAHRLLGAPASIAMHFGTFALGDDGENEAVDELVRLKRGTEDDKSFWIMEPGEGRDIAGTSVPPR